MLYNRITFIYISVYHHHIPAILIESHMNNDHLMVKSYDDMTDHMIGKVIVMWP